MFVACCEILSGHCLERVRKSQVNPVRISGVQAEI
jgi:hypothetical protein